ncbi:MAG: hypothetical protein ACLUE1_04210 [Adlercreutzia equolifaciens]
MSSKKNKTGAKNPTRKQQAERISRPRSERRAKEAAEAKARTRRSYRGRVRHPRTALGIPTMALTVLSL